MRHAFRTRRRSSCSSRADRLSSRPITVADIGGDAGEDAVESSTDGNRLVVYAEWMSEQAHREAIELPRYGGAGGIFDKTSGVQGLSVDRYQIYRSRNWRES